MGAETYYMVKVPVVKYEWVKVKAVTSQEAMEKVTNPVCAMTLQDYDLLEVAENE